MSIQSRNWNSTIFTPEGWTIPQVLEARDAFVDMPQATWAVSGMEKCPTSGKIHLQSACYLEKKTTLTGITKIIKEATGLHAHSAICKGTALQNQTYCKKDGSWGEKGTPPQQGKRSDLIALKDSVENGTSTYNKILMTDTHAIHTYGRVLKQVQDLVDSKKRRPDGFVPKGFWFWGLTGTGKSIEAWKQAKEYVQGNMDEIYLHNTEDKGWFQGYRGQKVMIIDELRGSDVKFKNLLTWCDQHPVNVPVRHATDQVPLLVERVYITSCMPPEVAYSGMNQTDSIDQLRRRYKVVEFHKFVLAGVVTYRQGPINELPARAEEEAQFAP